RGAARTVQCIDANSLVRAGFTNIVGENVGNIANISYKKTTPDNYIDYVNNVSPTALVPTRDVSFRGVHFKGAGNESVVPVLIGNDWGTYSGGSYSGGDHVGFPPVTNVTLDDWTIEDCSQIIV